MENSCVFCDPTKTEERLIHENEDYYVVATLGQIVGGYVIIVPKAHIPCLGDVSCRGMAEMNLVNTIYKTKRAITLEYFRDCFSLTNRVLMFEHGIVGQTVKHAHLHLLPADVDLTPRVRADFPAAEIQNISAGDLSVQGCYIERKEPYLFWSTPDGGGMICWNPPAPPMYLRLITAELLGFPERGNWRDMDRATDNKLLSETIRRLKSYFV